jgi:8-oxo-dGDP phosphatase
MSEPAGRGAASEGVGEAGGERGARDERRATREGGASSAPCRGAISNSATRAAAEDLEIRDAAESWPVSSSEVLAGDSLVRLRRDMVRMPEGDVVGRDILEHPGAVAILALASDERVLLIRQYRHPVRRLLWEIPAGLRDVAGEPLRVTAERELFEEAGYRAAQWHVLTDTFSTPGISTERLRIFLARGLAEVPEAERSYVREHEEALLTLAWLPLHEAVRRVLAGELHNGVTATGILAAYAARQGGFAALRDADAPER